MLRRIVSMLWVAVLGVTTASAQQEGQIIRVVTDSSGAVVEAVEVGPAFALSAIAGSAGEYVLPALRPTQHELVAEMRGFRSFPRSGVELLANQSLTLNVVLEVGAVTETVEVAGAAVHVNTTTSTLSEVVDWARIIELPLNGTDAARLAVLAPDTSIISVSAENGKSIPGGLQPSSSGTRNQQVAYKPISERGNSAW